MFLAKDMNIKKTEKIGEFFDQATGKKIRRRRQSYQVISQANIDGLCSNWAHLKAID